ncbi:MAG: peptidylprolyl isomerase [Fibrobacteria bacterium]|nr:peptidylprolyl isomerase [Fibrobacteria bacterium]
MRRFLALLLATAPLVQALPRPDAVAAVVGDQAIYLSEVREAMSMAPAEEANASTASKILHQMIDDRILLWRAKAETLQVGDAEVSAHVEQQIAQTVKQAGGEEVFAKALQMRLGLGMSQYRVRMMRQAREMILKQRLQDAHIPRAEPTRDEVMAFYAEYRDSLPVLANQVRVSQILLKIQATAQRDAQARREAEAVIERLRKGESFEAIARAESQDPSAVENGGDIGYFRRGELDPAYEKAALALETGRYTLRPVKSRFGWHVIELLGTRDQEFRTRHILRSLVPTQSDSDATRERADSLRRVANAGGDFQELARAFSDEKASGAFGGMLGWFTESDLKDPYKSILAAIPTGSVGEPLLSGDSYILLRIDQRTESRKMSPEEDWMQLSRYAAQVLSQRKLRTLVEKWRKEVNVEVRIDGEELARKLGL